MGEDALSFPAIGLSATGPPALATVREAALRLGRKASAIRPCAARLGGYAPIQALAYVSVYFPSELLYWKFCTRGLMTAHS